MNLRTKISSNITDLIILISIGVLVTLCAHGQPLSVAPPGTVTSGLVTEPTPATPPYTVPGVRAGCTPTSMSVAKAGSIAALELGRWNCYAQNITSQPQLVSQVGFSLDFIELHQALPADVSDIFTMKQKMSPAGVAARVIEVTALAAALATGLSGINLTIRTVTAISAVTYGAHQVGDYVNKQVPPTTNALAGMWGPADTIILQPGQGIQWKVYASKMYKAASLGPRMLTPVVMPVNISGTINSVSR